jgi:hypothetical protein
VSGRRRVEPRVEAFTVAADEPAHLTYTEPEGWTSPPRCLPTIRDALIIAQAVTTFAGPDAAARRTWRITACDCEGGGQR